MTDYDDVSGARPARGPAPTAAEIAALRRATVLAARGTGTALPNPVVGCVLLSAAGEEIGAGYHDHAGGPHAEIVALRSATGPVRGATAVVTLEPCNHTGRTGPCSQALIDAGIARVVVAVRDPWPTAAGGIDRLRAAGIDVVDLSAVVGGAADVVDAVTAAEDVNRVWLTATRRHSPFVTLKMATTIDGRVAAADGSSRWISSPESRAHAHRQRSEIDAIAVGVGTILADDPQLTARDESGAAVGRQPLRVVVDSTGRTPADARVRDAAAQTLIATVAEFGSGPDGRVDLASLLRGLFDRGCRHLLVEGGPRLATAFLDAELVDEVVVYLAPMLLGAGRSALEGGSVQTIADAHRLVLREAQPCGPDMVLRYSCVDSAGRFDRHQR